MLSLLMVSTDSKSFMVKLFLLTVKNKMKGCTCEKSSNGYYQWKCSIHKCRSCKDSTCGDLKSKTSNELVSVDQFEALIREFKKLNTKTNVIETKFSKLTDRVTTQMTYSALYKKFLSMRKKYTMHKFQVFKRKPSTDFLFPFNKVHSTSCMWSVYEGFKTLLM